MFVVGAEHENHEKNLKFASELHYILEEKYPGLSRGVYPKKKEKEQMVCLIKISQNKQF